MGYEIGLDHKDLKGQKRQFYVIVGREPFLFPASQCACHCLRSFTGKQSAGWSGERRKVPIRRLGLSSRHKMKRTQTIETGY